MARYKPSDPRDYLAALDFINKAKDNDLEIELKKFHPKRSNPQNRYLHLALSYFAHCYGCTLTEAKEIFLKRYAAPEIFERDFVDKNGHPATYYISTSELNTVEMSNAIKNFVAYASCNGIEIPDPTDELGIRYCEREIEKTTQYGT